jgi:hypothetical protein
MIINQTILEKSNTRIIIETDAFNLDVPYSETFYAKEAWIATAPNSDSKVCIF